jgi:hypothetical protein
VLSVILLVIILSFPERRQRQNLRSNRVLILSTSVQLFDRLASLFVLAFVASEDNGLVLAAPIMNERVGWVMQGPKESQQLPVGNNRRIKLYLYRFCMSCGSGAHVSVRGICRSATLVAAENATYAGYLAKGIFHPPESAGAEIC